MSVDEEVMTDLMEMDFREFVAKYDRLSVLDYYKLKGVSQSMIDLIGVALNMVLIMETNSYGSLWILLGNSLSYWHGRLST